MRKPVLAGLAAAILAVSSGCTGAPEEPPVSSAPDAPALIIGSPVTDPPIPGQTQVVAEVYAGALNAAGVAAGTRPDTGSREVYFKAVQDGTVDIVPDYSGNLLLHVDPTAVAAPADEVLAALPGKLPDGLAVLEPSRAEGRNALVVTKATAEKYQLKSIEDLAKVCSKIVLGAPGDFAQRPYGLPGLKENYGCEPGKFEPFSDGGGPVTLMALLTDQVQVASMSTTLPSIADNDLVVLEDPKNNFIAQQVLPLYNTSKVTDKAKETLNTVSRILTTEDLVNLNRAMGGAQKQSPKEAADRWLKDKGLAG